MKINAVQKANILSQALPYIQKYRGKIVVIKYGGNAMKNEMLKENVMKDVVLLTEIGVRVVLVHGGGPEINKIAEKYNGGGHKLASGARVKTMEEVEFLINDLDKACSKYIMKDEV